MEIQDTTATQDCLLARKFIDEQWDAMIKTDTVDLQKLVRAAKYVETAEKKNPSIVYTYKNGRDDIECDIPRTKSEIFYLEGMKYKLEGEAIPSMQLGRYSERQDLFKKAMESFRSAIVQCSSIRAYFLALADMAQKTHQRDVAIIALQEAQKRAPNDMDILEKLQAFRKDPNLGNPPGLLEKNPGLSKVFKLFGM